MYLGKGVPELHLRIGNKVELFDRRIMLESLLDEVSKTFSTFVDAIVLVFIACRYEHTHVRSSLLTELGAEIGNGFRGTNTMNNYNCHYRQEGQTHFSSINTSRQIEEE